MSRALSVRFAIAAAALAASGALAAGCGNREPSPAVADTAGEICRSCRMPVSQRRLAAQLTARGEEPAFFDDIGCLRDYLSRHAAPPDAVAWVADHRTAEWVRAARAVYASCPALETPMSSHLAAWSDEASAGADPVRAKGRPVGAEEALGRTPPDGRKEPAS